MDKKAYEKILADYLAGKLTPEQKAQVDHWLEATPLHDDENSIAWDETRQQRLLEVLHQKIDQKPARSITLTRWLQLAATLLIVALIAYYGYETAKTETRYVTTAEALTKTILQDGTIVWLKANSTLSYPERFTSNERSVSLTGEALFEVTKDPAHPFIVRCGGLTATVLGTSFNIRTGSDTIEVAVLTGKVALTSAHDQQGIVVMPREKAMYQIAQQRIVKVQAPPTELMEATALTDYNMHFEETNFREIIHRIEGKFNVTIKMESTALNACTITADLTDQSLQTTLQSMADVFEFEYTIKNNRVTIRGGSCR